VRVALLLGRSTGGIGTHVVELARDLRAQGDEVTVVTDELTARRFGLGDSTLAWPSRDLGLRGSVQALRTLRRVVRGSDVLHAHGHQAGLVGALATVRLPTPLVVSQHNAVLETGRRRRLLDLVQRVVVRRAALVTGASSDLVEEARRLGARDARLAEVPSPRVPALLEDQPAAEAARRRAARELLQRNGIDVPDGTPLVLTIARIAPQKDLATLVDAAATLQVSLTQHLHEIAPGEVSLTQHLHEIAPGEASLTRHVHEVAPVWAVVGGGDERLRDELVRQASRLRAPVHLVGQQQDPERWLRCADVFVLTSRWEARALVVQEAMAAGVPVVATDTGGLRDLVDGVGTLVEVGDRAAVSTAVGRFLTDPAARHTASVAGRERAASWDDGPATARRWREWYSALPGMT